MSGDVEFLDEDGTPQSAPDPAGVDVLDHDPGAPSARARLLAWGLAAAVVLAGGAAWLGDRGQPSGAAGAGAVPTAPVAHSVVPAVPTATVVIDPRDGAIVWPNTVPGVAPTRGPDQAQALRRVHSVSCVAHYLRWLVGMAEAYRDARAQGQAGAEAERAAADRLAEHVRKGTKRYDAVWRAWSQNRASLVHSGPVVMTEQCG